MPITSPRRFMPVLAASVAGLLTAGISAQAMAAESRGFVVRWFHYANVSEDADCPKGINPSAEGTFRRILRERGESAAEIEKKLENFPYSMYDANIGMRGTIDGKPANPYLNPTSTKDPNLHLGEGKKALGFNLDGKDGPKNFTDVETGEKGVDNMFYRAIGCSSQLRSAAGKLPTFPEIQWDMMRDHTPAWLIEISGIDDYQNDDDVMVTIVRATMPIVRDAQGQPQKDMTFTPDPTPRTDGNKVHGKIKNGLLLTETFDFFMPGEPFAQAEYRFKDARMRFTFLPNGDLKGIVGGYQNWRTIYTSWALGGATYEINAGYDVPGMYYALKKTADAYPDPKTGENTHISSAYLFDAIPAFIEHPEAKTAQAGK
jgi:hypothetical protein